MPEPPVINGRSAAAAPISTRSESLIVSTTISVSPRPSAASSAARMALRPLQHDRRGDVTDFRAALAGQPAPQIGVGHRRQRMLLHAAFVEQLVANEEVALIDRPFQRRIGRAHDDAGRSKRVGECVRDRADIAIGRGVERRAVLEEELGAALGLQPMQGGERLADGVGGSDRSRLQRNDARLDVLLRRTVRHAGILHRAHAALGQRVRDVGRTREIVTNATEKNCRPPRGRARWGDKRLAAGACQADAQKAGIFPFISPPCDGTIRPSAASARQTGTRP